MSLYSSPTFAQQVVKGVVTDISDKPIETASVVFNGALTVLTDAQGRFTLSNVQAGMYEYYVSCLGYAELRGTMELKGDGSDKIHFKLREQSLTLKEVTVTAEHRAMGSISEIGSEAIKHIQPKSLADMLQLVPGGITVNPTLNNLAQAQIREIGNDDNNAMGTAVIVDGAPLSNDANLQAISPSKSGANSSTNADGMSNQTTASRGVDLRTVSADNIESVQVIRGIPGVEYGNLTSGVVIVKTKAGRSPLEVKFKTDPFSKLVYAGKGFGLAQGGTINLGVDWSQSYSDTRRKYRGYDRITATMGYSNVFGSSTAHPITFNLNASLYNNINNYKSDAQLKDLGLEYKNENMGGRLAINGNIKPGSWLSSLDYSFSAQVSRTLDTHHDRVATPDGVVTNSMVSGEALARILTKAYNSDYKLESLPINLFGQVIAMKYIGLSNHNYTNLKFGLEYRMDDNQGNGLTFDMQNPPLASGSQTLRPRSYKDIPGISMLSAFAEDNALLHFGTTALQLGAGLRVTNMFLNKDRSGRNGIFVAEPRLNVEYTFLNKENNSVFDKLSISGGFGISNKMPTLLYLYPDAAYFDSKSLSMVGTDSQSSLAVMTTKVVTNTQNTDLKPSQSTKWELGLNARIGQMKGFVTFFNERYRNEFGFDGHLEWLKYRRFNVPTGATNPAFTNGNVTYTLNGTQQTADYTTMSEMVTWSKPMNNSRTDKYGIEYSWDFGAFKPLRTTLHIDGAWFHIKRQSETKGLSYINSFYDYVGLMPAGEGTINERVNTNFRFITYLPAIKMVFTTTLQVVWHESTQSIYQLPNGKDAYHLSTDGTRYVVSPVGFYDQSGQYTEWQSSFDTDARYARIPDQYMLYAFKADVIRPWALVNFRLTKELGRIAELTFMANNFLNLSRYHMNQYTKTQSQLYPDMYFGAELNLKF